MLKKTKLLLSTLGLFGVASAYAASFEVHSANLHGERFTEQQVANSFGCHGKNISPQISWTGAPSGTKSFLVSMYDPDAPTGSGFWHWVVADLPASTKSLAEGINASQLPKGALAIRNDAGMAAYLGACPPQGETHRYIISVTALNVAKLGVDKNATPAVVGFTAHFHTLAKASLTMRYGR